MTSPSSAIHLICDPNRSVDHFSVYFLHEVTIKIFNKFFSFEMFSSDYFDVRKTANPIFSSPERSVQEPEIIKLR